MTTQLLSPLVAAIDRIGRAVCRPAAWKLPLALTVGVVLGGATLRVVVIIYLLGWGVSQVRRIEGSDRSCSISIGAVQRWSLIIFVAAVIGVVTVLLSSVGRHEGWW